MNTVDDPSLTTCFACFIEVAFWLFLLHQAKCPLNPCDPASCSFETACRWNPLETHFPKPQCIGEDAALLIYSLHHARKDWSESPVPAMLRSPLVTLVTGYGSNIIRAHRPLPSSPIYALPSSLLKSVSHSVLYILFTVLQSCYLGSAFGSVTHVPHKLMTHFRPNNCSF